ncbi:hypothetical protein [Burkholderia cenocepacia]|uniref:hypothetical protein n=1 Tax=Burkholderia cenocepacia TaxID=95486 RepID=UPI001BA46ED3|nr:hypothetical protein [Burkholderia cenocepacia]MEB2499545.1 hypothetical protein [Burkholderia cenocepacia]MEB2557220.1 hypothetical protein [Burkholderia cenocepacia]QUN44685.1 hypothetical protein KEH56_36560 [Burkholderia cenocepacia]QUO23839.1 hypothetical protein KEH57_09570 [Burkholderia cenocepacia]QUO26151.1 hypothetical protein KEH57_04270 [Burkholderia cenocepacia]
MGLNASIGQPGVWQSAENDARNLLFGPDSTGNLSHTIQVDISPIIVRAFNLDTHDRVRVEMVDGDGAGRHFAPFCPRGVQESLVATRNVLPIAIPGRYRFVLDRDDGGQPAVGIVTVRYHDVTMTHEWLVAYLK